MLALFKQQGEVIMWRAITVFVLLLTATTINLQPQYLIRYLSMLYLFILLIIPGGVPRESGEALKRPKYAKLKKKPCK